MNYTKEVKTLKIFTWLITLLGHVGWPGIRPAMADGASCKAVCSSGILPEKESKTISLIRSPNLLQQYNTNKVMYMNNCEVP